MAWRPTDGTTIMTFVVGLVLEAEPVPGKDKLLKLSVDVAAGEPLAIVTNAPNVQQGSRVVVAMIGTELPDGTTVKKANVGGVNSEGMLCDSPMLSWVGGGAGTAAIVPESFAPGDAPPAERPRGGPSAAAAAPAAPAVDVKPLFEKKLSKDEKKAAAAAKKAERDAKKAGKKGDDAAEVEGTMADLALSGEGGDDKAAAES